jgi:hypothetical protein
MGYPVGFLSFKLGESVGALGELLLVIRRCPCAVAIDPQRHEFFGGKLWMGTNALVYALVVETRPSASGNNIIGGLKRGALACKVLGGCCNRQWRNSYASRCFCSP